MPQLHDYLTALTTNFSVQVDSTQKLLNDVNAAQAKRGASLTTKGKPIPPAKASLTKVGSYDPAQTISIQPISLLHAIGRATTPPIPNLVELSATWAVIRYMWAFSLPLGVGTPRLRLSDQARQIDFHQKGLLSDQMGVGFACYMMARDYGMHDPIDVDVALKRPHWNVSQQYKRAPDYLFTAHPSSSTYIVECKGTQTSRASSIDQIRSGTEQVPSIVFNDGRTSTGLIFATCLQQKKTTVYIVDPPGDDGSRKDIPPEQTSAPSMWAIPNENEFLEAMHRLGNAKLLAFSGSNREAAALAPVPLGKAYYRQMVTPEMRMLKSKFGVFQGASEAIESADGVRVVIYRGLHADRRRQILPSEQKESRHEESTATYESYVSGFKREPYQVEIQERERAIEITSYGRDGTVLQVVVSNN